MLSAINDKTSALCAKLTREFEQHLGNAEWDTSDIYWSTGRVEAEVYNTELTDYELISNATNVWPVEGDLNTWIVELDAQLTVEVEISVEFFVWDSIDHDEVNMGNDTCTIPITINVEAFLTCTEIQLDNSPDEWGIDIEIADGSYSIDGFEVEPDFSDGE